MQELATRSLASSNWRAAVTYFAACNSTPGRASSFSLARVPSRNQRFQNNCRCAERCLTSNVDDWPSVRRFYYRFRSRVNVPIENVDKGSVTFVRERSPANATMYLFDVAFRSCQFALLPIGRLSPMSLVNMSLRL